MGRNYSRTSKSLNTTITHSHCALQFQSIQARAYHVCMVSVRICFSRIKGATELMYQNQMAFHEEYQTSVPQTTVCDCDLSSLLHYDSF